ncbi:phosphopantetheine adenylyltransferase [Candidatus Bathyarchaeota archaeon]|nr:phosphopantetheine adenylyltransferase [Candidatus Bathyarchaeota archaeon]
MPRHKPKFKTVAVGGTFDEFHKGHRTLLLKAFEVGERVLIGLCTDDFVKKLGKPHVVAPYEQRLEELKAFLGERGLINRAEIIPLDDVYGVTLSPGCVEALVVSRETEPTAIKINEERRKRGLAPLAIIVVEMVPAENHVPISTTRIRMGEIDREGRLLKT